MNSNEQAVRRCLVSQKLLQNSDCLSSEWYIHSNMNITNDNIDYLAYLITNIQHIQTLE